MNLNAYDSFEKKINYWINIKNKTLYLRNIKYRDYYSFFCRYDNVYKEYDCYILLTDNPIPIKDEIVHKMTKTSKGVMQLYLDRIWNNITFEKTNNFHPVNLTLEEKTETSEFYKLELYP